ncbi:MAG TPA: cytochrome D1 domain-containing protein [Burkholderiales bacterium]
MKTIGFVLVLLAVSALALPARAATLVVLNKSEHTASLIDPDTGKTITKLPVGRGPHELIVSPDGRTAYVSNFGRYNNPCPQGDTTTCQNAGNTITVLDLAGRKVKGTYDYGTNTGQHGSVISRDGKYVWVTSETPQSLLEIDASTGKIVNQWKTNQDRSHLVVVTADEKKFYVTNTVSGSVSVVDRGSGAVKVIPVGKGAEAITISPDGGEVWVAMPVDNKIAVISTTKDAIVETFDSGGAQPQRIRFTPDGKEVWVSHVSNDTLTVIDAKTRKAVGNVSVGKRPQGIDFSPDGRRGYFALSGSNQVAVVDVAARKLIQNFDTGLDPDGIAFAR